MDAEKQTRWETILDTCYFIFLCYLVGGELVTKPLLQFTHSILHVPGKIDTIALYALIALIAAAGLYGKVTSGKFSFKPSEIVLFCVLFSVFLIGYARSTAYSDMFLEMLRDFLLGILAYLWFRCCDDTERLLRAFAVMSVLMTAAMFLLLLLSGNEKAGQYSQYYGYMIFPACVIAVNEAIRKKSVFYTLIAAAAFLLTFLMGGRGPILFELIFLVIRLIGEPIRPAGKVAVSGFIAAVGSLIYFNLFAILEWLNQLAVSANFSSRIFDKLLMGKLYESGRSQIYEAAWKVVERHPFFGAGIGKDRIEIAKIIRSDAPIGTYPHNFMLELLVQFGIVAGVVLIICFVIFEIRAYRASHAEKVEHDLFWIMLMVGFVPLLASSSYFTYPMFYAMLAWQLSALERDAVRKDN